MPHITHHAVSRFRERVRDVPENVARDEMLYCLAAVKPKKRREMDKRSRNTVIAPTGCCVFIASKGKIVSVVKELRDATTRT